MNVPSAEFLGFSAIVAVLLNIGRAAWWRQAVMLVANFAFLASFSLNPRVWLPYAVFMAFGYAAVSLMQSRSHSARRLFPLLCILTIAIFAWLKRYTILPAESFLPFPYVVIGLSYVFFRVLHLIIDARSGMLPGSVGPVSYLNFTLNFTSLVSGPIQRYQDYHRMVSVERNAIDINAAGNAVQRIIVGLFKVAILSDLTQTVQTTAWHALTPDQPLTQRVILAAVTAAVYPVYLYFNFSGYTDVVIGVARFLGLSLPENFDRPFAAGNFLDFWSRWHITLSTWLKTYVYMPLLMSLARRFPSQRVEPLLAVSAFFVTFFLVGLWHGRTSEFLVFGFLQGFGVAANKLYQIAMTRRLGRSGYRALCADRGYHALARGLTFTWFAFTLFWFWMTWGPMEQFAHAAGGLALALATVTVMLAATVLLTCMDVVRRRSLSLTWHDQPVLLSRYTRTVWCTALVLVTVSATALFNLPAPDIVYQAF
jgi:alginate O-acetyltransferase complex protein AlgI